VTGEQHHRRDVAHGAADEAAARGKHRLEDGDRRGVRGDLRFLVSGLASM
jgi:hypothetical protein